MRPLVVSTGVLLRLFLRMWPVNGRQLTVRQILASLWLGIGRLWLTAELIVSRIVLQWWCRLLVDRLALTLTLAWNPIFLVLTRVNCWARRSPLTPNLGTLQCSRLLTWLVCLQMVIARFVWVSRRVVVRFVGLDFIMVMAPFDSCLGGRGRIYLELYVWLMTEILIRPTAIGLRPTFSM